MKHIFKSYTPLRRLARGIALCVAVLGFSLGAYAQPAVTPVITSGLDFTAIVDENGDLFLYGANSPEGPRRVEPEGVWESVSVSPTSYAQAHVLAIRTDGTLWAFGLNSHGQLGTGNTTDREEPAEVQAVVDEVTEATGTFSDWVEVSCGTDFSIGRRSGGQVYVWGNNSHGQVARFIYDKTPLGVGDPSSTRNTYTNPLPLDSESYISIAAGEQNGIAIRADGSMYSWGYSANSKQLGVVGSNLVEIGPVLVPQRIGTSNSWTKVFPGVGMHFALQGGELYVWGPGNFGQDGFPSGTPTASVPTRVGSFSDWVDIAVGSNHALGLRADGSLYGWGSNQDGELGLLILDSGANLEARNFYKHEPFPLLVGQDIQGIAAGDRFSSIIDDVIPSVVRTSGMNEAGQLGLGFTSPGSDYTFENDTVDFGILYTVNLELSNLVLVENPDYPGLAPETNLVAGENIFISVEMSNLGAVDLTDDFLIGAQLSEVPAYDDSSAIPLVIEEGSVTYTITTNIDAEDSVTIGLRLMLPATLESGDYYLVMRGDLDYDLNENESVRPNDVVSGVLSFVPDVSAQVQILSNEFDPGDVVNSVIMINNVGNWSTSQPFDITAVLSPSAFYDSPSAIPLSVTLGGTVTDNINPSESFNAFVSVELPGVIADGCYYLIYRLDDAEVLGEIVVDNNDAVVADQICFGPVLSDLIITDVVAINDPLNPSSDPANNLIAGGQLVVSMNLGNIGNSDITQDFELAAVLSASEFFDDPGAIPLTFIDGQLVDEDIPVDGVVSVGARFQLPDFVDIDSGIYNLIIRGDSGEVLTEITRVNNDGALASLSFIPDLQLNVEILTDEIEVLPTVITAIATIQNVGSWSAQGGFELSGVIVTTPFFDGLTPEDLFFTSDTVILDDLDPGEVIEVPMTFYIPPVDDDCYYLAFRVDDDRVLDEVVISNNDSVTQEVCFGLEAADLSVNSVSALENPAYPGVDPLSNLISGGELIVSIDLSNVGDLDITDDFDLAAYLSPSNFISDPDAVQLTFIDGETVESDIDVGENVTVGARLQLPVAIEHGSYNLIIVGDSGEVLTEVSRVNNTAQLAGLPFIPDVAISFELVESLFALDEEVDVIVTLTNVGTWTAIDDFDITAVLNTTPFYEGLSAVPLALIGDPTVTDDLDPGDTIDVPLSFILSSSLEDGEYYLAFRADDARVLDEEVLSNNDAVSVETLSVGMDITVTEIDISDLNPDPGTDLSVSVSLKNLGSRDIIDPFDLVAFLSLTGEEDDPDAIPVLFDGGLSEYEVSPPLPAATEVSLPVILEFPADLDQGDYYLVFCADPTDAILELNEDNNCLSSDDSFGVRPDLVFDLGAGGVVLTPNNSPYNPGDPISLDLFIENTGAGGLPEGTEFAIRLFLSSTTSTTDPVSIDLDSEIIYTAPVGGFNNATGTETISLGPIPYPEGLDTGFYYIGAIIDVNEEITEQTELLAEDNTVIREDGEANNTFFSATATVEVNGISLPEAMDQLAFVFPTSGDGTWFGQDSFSNFGGDAARSPAISGGESAIFSTTFSSSSIISFDWYSDTIGSDNRLVFRVIGDVTSGGTVTISGESTDWETVSRVVPAGATVEWEYIEDVDAEDDAVFVDNLTIVDVTAPELIIDAINLTEAGEIIESGSYVLNSDQMTLNINSRNQGSSTGPLDEFVVSVYLSNDRNFDRPDGDPGTADDVLLRQVTIDEIFGPGNLALNGISIDLPLDITPGSYYLIGYIDDYTDENGDPLPGTVNPTGSVAEFVVGGYPGETNNLFITEDPVVSIVALPNLVVNEVNAEPGYYFLRQLNPVTNELEPNVIDFDFEIANTGLAAVTDPLNIKILLSRDTVMDPASDYVVLEYEYTGGLGAFGAAGGSDVKTIDPGAVDIREDLVDLGYIGERLYFGVFIDSDNVIVELNENDNGINTIDNDFIFTEVSVAEAVEFDTGAGNLVNQDEDDPFDGELPWVGQTTTTVDGVDAAMSLDISNDEISAFETVIDAGLNPTFVTFRWRVSSQNDEFGRDTLSFYIDDFDNPSAQIYGTEDGWIRVSRLVSAGQHTLRWEYKKDSTISSGEDRGWVDDVSFQTPNLVVDDVTMPTLGYAAGDTIDTWSVTITNDGLAGVPTTPEFDVELRVSSNNTWGTGLEYVLLSITDSDGLAVGESRTYTELTHGPLPIPDDISLAADYFVGAYVDWSAAEPATGAIPEFNENDNSLFTDAATITIAPAITLYEALEVNPLDFTLDVGSEGSSKGWFGVADSQIPGGGSNGDAAKSGTTEVGESSYLETIVEGPYVLNFDWKVSSRVGSNYLEFSINGVVQERISGEVDWTAKEFFIPAGTQELRWTYSKTGDAGEYEDAGWVDEVVFTPFSDPELVLTSLIYTPGRYVLDVAGIAGSPDQLVGTEYLDITVEAENQGLDLVGPDFTVSDLEVRLSVDRIYGNADDIVLGTVNQVEGTLEAGDLLRFLGPIQLGDSIPEGFYYLIARVDANDSLTDEYTEENNIVISENNDIEIARLPALRIVNDPLTTEQMDGENFYLDPTDDGGASYAFDIDESKFYYTEGPMRLRFDIQNIGLGRIEGTTVWTTEVNLRGIKREDILNSLTYEEFIGSVAPLINLGSFTVQELMEGRSEAKPDGDIVEVDIDLALPSGARLNDIIDTPEYSIADYLWFIEVKLDSEDVVEESQIVRESPLLVAPSGLPWWIIDINEALAFDNDISAINSTYNDGLFGITSQVGGPGTLLEWGNLYQGASILDDDNILAYAFDRNPADGDTAGGQFPGSSGFTNFEGDDYFSISFDIVTRASDLIYRVEAADTLPIEPGAPGYTVLVEIEGPYDELTGAASLTGDGGLIDEPNVISVIDQGYSARVTVKDDVSSDPDLAPSRFIQIDVIGSLDQFAIDEMALAGVVDPDLNRAFDDADLDGVANIYEILLGTDPNDIGDFPTPTTAEEDVAIFMFYYGVTSPAANGPLDDADSDGESNIVELVRGSDPNNSSDISSATPAEEYVIEQMVVTFGADVESNLLGLEDDYDGGGDTNIAELQLGATDPTNALDDPGYSSLETHVATKMAEYGALNGISGVTPGDLGPDDDADTDGKSNIIELQLGNDPNNGADTPASGDVLDFVAEGMADSGILTGVNAFAFQIDPDGDFDVGGASNLGELAFGFDPNNAGDDPVSIDDLVEAEMTGTYGAVAPDLQADDDKDGDAATNLEEIATGFDPTDGGDTPAP